MTTSVFPGLATTTTGAPLPVVALPQGELLTVNIDQIPMLKDLVAPGIHVQPLGLDLERGEWVFLATLAPGCELPLHYHTGPAQVWSTGPRSSIRRCSNTSSTTTTAAPRSSHPATHTAQATS